MKKVAQILITFILCYSNVKAIKIAFIKPIHHPYKIELRSSFGTAHIVEELPEFNVTLENDKVQIKWVIESTSDISDFIIEKSNDGKKFKKLSDVKCNSKDYSEYFETDYHPAICYRIKQLTPNHEVKYSQTVFVRSEHGKLKHHKEDTHLPNLQNTQNTFLVVLRNKQGDEYISKIFVSVVDNKLYGTEEKKMIPPGDYLIISSKSEVLDKQRIEIK
jgi:hypothetical protein